MNFTWNRTRFQGFNFKLLGHFWVWCSVPTEKAEIPKVCRILFRRMCPSATGSYWDANRLHATGAQGNVQQQSVMLKTMLNSSELDSWWSNAAEGLAIGDSASVRFRFFTDFLQIFYFFAWILEEWIKFRGSEWGGCHIWAGKGKVWE